MNYSKGVRGLSAATIVAGCVATTASAQQSDWSYEATIYLFTPETETSTETAVGTLDGTLSFSDALSNLDFAFMGAFAATNGTWSVLADYNFTDLSFSENSPGPANADLDVSVKTQFLTGMLGYRVYENPSVKVDLAGGFRWFSTDTDFKLTPGSTSGFRTTVDDDWFDPIIGARARFVLSDRWTSTALVDYGGFRSDSETWQVLVTADYSINENWVLRAGYRYITFDHKIDGSDFEFTQSGPLFGATYRF